MKNKLRESSSGTSRIHSLVRKVKSIKARNKSHTTIKHYQKNINLATLGNSSKLKDLSTVSRIPIPQSPTILDKSTLREKYTKSIIDIGKIHIPEMEVIMSDIPTIKFPSLESKEKHYEHHPNADIKTELKYIIAIPSYNRPELIQNKTLALLHQCGIDVRLINIFVANKEQHELYKNKIPSNLYGKIITGVIGLKNQRNFIMNYYPEGMNIVQMDDDLDKIMELVLKKHLTRHTSPRRLSHSDKSLKPIGDLDGFIRKAFEICREKGIYLWGVYPLANARFMSPKMTTDLRFIVGPFWGIINRHRQDLKLTIDEKENAERTLQHYNIDHAVLRFNNIGIETRYYKNKGGMQNEGKNRKEEALKSAYYLHNKYPKYTKIHLDKKSGVPEIKMVRT